MESSLENPTKFVFEKKKGRNLCILLPLCKNLFKTKCLLGINIYQFQRIYDKKWYCMHYVKAISIKEFYEISPTECSDEPRFTRTWNIHLMQQC